MFQALIVELFSEGKGVNPNLLCLCNSDFSMLKWGVLCFREALETAKLVFILEIKFISTSARVTLASSAILAFHIQFLVFNTAGLILPTAPGGKSGTGNGNEQGEMNPRAILAVSCPCSVLTRPMQRRWPSTTAMITSNSWGPSALTTCLSTASRCRDVSDAAAQNLGAPRSWEYKKVYPKHLSIIILLTLLFIFFFSGE